MSEFTVDFNDKTVAYKQLLNDFKTLIRKNNLKFTLQTELILETLYNSDEHLAPESLHHLIQDKFPDLNIGIATVYRTLSLLEESKMVASLSFGAQGKKYELEAKEHHDHIICTACGNITEFVDMQIEERQHHIANDLGFKMLDHSMQIYGICKTCQNK
ncbi:MAG: transcriptional repressor [Epsilonproteobacteria bacterium]|nr:transcriptional repressor [Campylobacterota bacterium]OIO14834.1 MAG: transcriptional repressor [Helicobacteraceae bacterium CG1_02_36_14]PIP10922.1 MAG: transcriptional repressor [Sulfurimonas sp. CG23_combo_of_CG06-09_8_20_14_all_36_33]PIS26781.1 MAG: transcriptional repressor [Sulfurimonas sp. CG08_land_8_20_14_0_20_36_33]PIU35099.1 MAG: transcriptional repressor [Sulfurimonas sp. CG07_land_8_20_14_0_80_36_56]PIV03344.1 MAG: transcriptional repressor [Sulfurimonas sp. CG03_land_8_20_14_0